VATNTRPKEAIKMPRNPTNSILKAIKAFVGPQITKDNGLNPVHLEIATLGYRIQSHMLHIPDRFGFFSSGPPRLQVYKGALFASLIVMLVYSIFWGALIVFLSLFRVDPPPIWRLVVAMVALMVGTLAVCWVMACFDKYRAPDYDGGDWKLRKEW
jgi:hypothetical protein